MNECVRGGLEVKPMKIEIGESLCYSYLRHVKGCWLVQTNWKSSEHWVKRKTDTELEGMFQQMREEFDSDGSVFKRTAAVGQFMQQGEIDVIGIDQDGNIHALDVAFHEAGLNYGGGVANRVLKKVLRAYILLNAYHPSGTRFQIYFVSPKVHPAVQGPLEDIFVALRKKYSETCWHLITNADFSECVVGETLGKADTVADTSELFVRSAKLLNLSSIPEVKERNVESANARPSERAARTRIRVQPLVKGIMRTLLEECPTILEEEDLRNMMDNQYCKNALSLKIGNQALLRERQQGRDVNGHSRYWRDLYAGRFYVCSQWWKDHHRENAKGLLRLVEALAQRKPHHPNINELEGHIAALREFIAAG